MVAIIIIFIIISAIISCISICYFKYIRISDITARKIEILGYILLFIVLVWELVLKNLFMERFYDLNWFYLNEKLHYIFLMMESDLGISAINNQAVIDGFNSAFPKDYIQIQMKFVDIIESGLKIISTIFITLGRVQELKSNTDRE